MLLPGSNLKSVGKLGADAAMTVGKGAAKGVEKAVAKQAEKEGYTTMTKTEEQSETTFVDSDAPGKPMALEKEETTTTFAGGTKQPMGTMEEVSEVVTSSAPTSHTMLQDPNQQ